MNNGTYIYEHILRNGDMMNAIDMCISACMQNCTIQPGRIPELVLTIVTLLNSINIKNIKGKINKEDIRELFDHFYQYIVDKHTLEFDTNEFGSAEMYNLYKTCIDLVIVQLKCYTPSSKKCL